MSGLQGHEQLPDISEFRGHMIWSDQWHYFKMMPNAQILTVRWCRTQVTVPLPRWRPGVGKTSGLYTIYNMKSTGGIQACIVWHLYLALYSSRLQSLLCRQPWGGEDITQQTLRWSSSPTHHHHLLPTNYTHYLHSPSSSPTHQLHSLSTLTNIISYSPSTLTIYTYQHHLLVTNYTLHQHSPSSSPTHHLHSSLSSPTHHYTYHHHLLLTIYTHHHHPLLTNIIYYSPSTLTVYTHHLHSPCTLTTIISYSPSKLTI